MLKSAPWVGLMSAVMLGFSEGFLHFFLFCASLALTVDLSPAHRVRWEAVWGSELHTALSDGRQGSLSVFCAWCQGGFFPISYPTREGGLSPTRVNTRTSTKVE